MPTLVVHAHGHGAGQGRALRGGARCIYEVYERVLYLQPGLRHPFFLRGCPIFTPAPVGVLLALFWGVVGGGPQHLCTQKLDTLWRWAVLFAHQGGGPRLQLHCLTKTHPKGLSTPKAISFLIPLLRSYGVVFTR